MCGVWCAACGELGHAEKDSHAGTGPGGQSAAAAAASGRLSGPKRRSPYGDASVHISFKGIGCWSTDTSASQAKPKRLEEALTLHLQTVPILRFDNKRLIPQSGYLG